MPNLRCRKGHPIAPKEQFVTLDYMVQAMDADEAVVFEAKPLTVSCLLHAPSVGEVQEALREAGLLNSG